ncbi:sulfurtransferase complex subunit TusB [Aeromonas simiae]|uniref:Sulfurtransferase complex subunit TusB n=1 Tax=Aeromonas simiae TaxID=218936 RepID=A0A5J6X3S4_9GAMM|nr:sulfurtransferase complex subunit TusB [Aeromonas simiae]QFI56515.1 sulfurtransferase complex subunit TusB [Aeromonas simiae]
MLHLVMSSPFTSSALEQYLAYRSADDALVLLQDGVIAASAPQHASRLQGVALYVLEEDLKARGLEAKVGTLITMTGLVDLVARLGSPHSWPE